MSLLEARLLADTGLLLLILITELITYPSFRAMSTERLSQWHAVYTQRISYLVAPLMFTQAILGAAHTYVQFNGLSLATFILILLCFALTFLQAVPLHNQIARGEKIAEAVEDLIAKNKYRTFIWSLVFLLGLADLLMH